MAEKVTVTLPDGSTFEREEPLIPLRTSVKGVGIAGGGTAVAIVQLIQSVDWPGEWFDQFIQTDMFVAGLPLLVAFIASYVSKSPIEPGKL